MSPIPTSDAEAAQAQLQRALALAQSGRKREAVDDLHQLCARQPANVSARCLLAVLLRELGDDAAALRELDAGAQFAPRDARLQETRAAVLLALGQFSAAETAAHSALSSDGQRPQALLQLALALDAQARSTEAVMPMRTLLARHPEHALARRLLVRGLLARGDAADALAAARHSSVLGDQAAAASMVTEFMSAGAHAQASDLLRDLLQRDPRNYTLVMQMARVLHQSGRSSEALAWSERAQQLAPQASEPREMHAVSLIDRGEVEAGLALYRELLARDDVDADTASRYLILAHYDPAQDNAALFAAHRDWARRYAQPVAAPLHAQSRDHAQRPLKIGWISPRFGAGPVASFFTALLEAFDHAHFEHCLVMLRPGTDAASARLRASAHVWLDLHALDDASLLQQLRAQNFDIVIDLAGHAVGNRLRVLAQRVAPIQLCWLDYFDTTAVDAMDGWISDAWLTPPGSAQRYTERVHRLDAGRFCYTPPSDAPPATRSGDGATVFASFNRLAKLNAAVLDAWCAILARVPQSRLELGTQLLDDAVARTRTLERFAQRGIAADRLGLHGRRSYAQLLQAYRGVDIALDPFPFSGCTTTCDALWMGVPVIARDGETFVARQSASLLARLDRAEWIAADDADYIERAVELAAQVDTLRTGRTALRERTRDRLCNASAQARDFAALLRRLWQDRGQSAA